MKKTMGEFTLEIKEGEFTDSEIVVMLGENGEFAQSWLSIKTSLNDKQSCCIDDSLHLSVHRHRENHIYQDAGRIPQTWWRRWEFITHRGHMCWRTHADVCSVSGDIPILNVSFKPQTISPKFKVSWTVFVLTWQWEVFSLQSSA